MAAVFLGGLPLLTVAIGGLAAQPAVPSVICGATRPDQIVANVAAGLWQPSADDLACIARDLQDAGARLVTITGHAPKEHSDKGFFEVSYHFLLRGVSLNILVVPEGTQAAVPSITRWHKAADWAERELAETYDITVTDHPDMRPLFLNDETRDSARSRMVPLSVMTNSAVTSTLWERIMGEKNQGENLQ